MWVVGCIIRPPSALRSCHARLLELAEPSPSSAPECRKSLYKIFAGCTGAGQRALSDSGHPARAHCGALAANAVVLASVRCLPPLRPMVAGVAAVELWFLSFCSFAALSAMKVISRQRSPTAAAGVQA